MRGATHRQDMDDRRGSIFFGRYLEAMVTDFVTSGLVADNQRTNRLLAAPRPGFITDFDLFTPQELATEPMYRDLPAPVETLGQAQE